MRGREAVAMFVGGDHPAGFVGIQLAMDRGEAL